MGGLRIDKDEPGALWRRIGRRPILGSKGDDMREDLRRAVALIAASLARQTLCENVYSYTSNEHTRFSGTLSGEAVALFDHGAGHGAGALITGQLPTLMHHGVAASFEVEAVGDGFKGFDYGSGAHYQVTLNNGEV